LQYTSDGFALLKRGIDFCRAEASPRENNSEKGSKAVFATTLLFLFPG